MEKDKGPLVERDGGGGNKMPFKKTMKVKSFRGESFVKKKIPRESEKFL